MAKPVTRLALTAPLVLALSGCGGGMSLNQLNPFTWFGSDSGADTSTATVTTADGEPVPVPPRVVDDGRVPVAAVDGAGLERTPHGIILRASGQVSGLGYFSPALRPINGGRPDANGTVWYDLAAFPPASALGPGTEAQRRISTATFLSRSRLAAIRQINVSGAGNTVTLDLR